MSNKSGTMGPPPVVMYMATFPSDHLLPELCATPSNVSAGIIWTSSETEAEEDLVEIIDAVDEYVVGRTITEDIMRLREKVAIARDRQKRRTGK
jgi:hypothetical protein